MNYVKTFEQFNIEQNNEGFKDSILDVVDTATGLLSSKKRKLIKLLNDDDTTIEDMIDLIKYIFDLNNGKGQDIKLEYVNKLSYNDALNILVELLKKLETSIKLPDLNLVRGSLVLA